jgi:hypothetical protein
MDPMPLAHAGHWLANVAFFLVPVGSILAMIWILNRRGPKDPNDRES